MYIHYIHRMGSDVSFLCRILTVLSGMGGACRGGARTHALPVLPLVGGGSLSGDAPSPAL